MKMAQAGMVALMFAGMFPLHSQSSSDLRTAAALTHVRNSFKLTVHASYQDTAPLFGPNGERSWAGAHWNPQFLYPQPGPHSDEDVQGVVFTVAHGAHTAVWLNTLFDVDARHFQYVYFIPDMVVTQIDVRFEPLAANSTEVQVVYTRTALTTEANEDVQSLGDADRTSGEHWQKAINDYLASERHK
ncbi:MAG: hypothetical protein ACR2JE_09620 [Acidobacteriaceae bacterium]